MTTNPNDPAPDRSQPVDPPPAAEPLAPESAATPAPTIPPVTPIPPVSTSPPRTAPLAGAALGLAMLGACVPLVGIAAWVVGKRALDEIDRHEGRLGGRDMARAATLIGAASTLVFAALLLLGVLLPTLAKNRVGGHGGSTTTQLRGIHQGMVIYAQSNNNYLPGLSATGDVLPNGADTGYSGVGSTGSARLWVLLNGQFIGADLAISPAETLTKWVTGSVTTANHSYALLTIADSAGDTTAHAGRLAEWKDNANSQAILLTDRNTGITNGDALVKSLWTTAAGDWKGNSVWGDNHAGFEVSNRGFSTRYLASSQTNDNLFADAAAPGVTESSSTRGANALLAWD